MHTCFHQRVYVCICLKVLDEAQPTITTLSTTTVSSSSIVVVILVPRKRCKKSRDKTTTTHSPVGFPGSTPYDHRPALTPNASSHKQSYTGTSTARPIVASLSLLSLLCVSHQSLGSNVLLPPPSHLCFVPRHDE
ncbi:unnamed protein product [Ectocarpus sp. 12 AP-2014]